MLERLAIEQSEEALNPLVLLSLETVSFRVGYGFSAGFGNMAFAYDPGELGVARVIANRRNFTQGLGLSLNDLVVMKPVHGDNIVWVNNSMRGMGVLDNETAVPGTDGLITKEKGIGLVLNPADCAPIIITNKSADFIAMIHAGREGTEKGICGKAVGMLKDSGYDPAGFLVGIGPARLCYEQQFIKTQKPEDWRSFLMTLDPVASLSIERLEAEATKPFVLKSSTVGDNLRVDFLGFNILQLVRSGVNPENIDLVGFCTFCRGKNGEIFSHSLATKYPENYKNGRFMSIAWLKA